MPTALQIDEPQTLTGLFPPDSSSDEEGEKAKGIADGDDDVCLEATCGSSGTTTSNTPGKKKGKAQERLLPYYETQSVDLVGRQLQIRQFDFHSHNANRVWPGTFVLAEYLLLPFPAPAAAAGVVVVPEEVSSLSSSSFTNISLGQHHHLHSSEPKQSSTVRWWGRVLELGTATGLLAIGLAMASSTLYNADVNITSTDLNLHSSIQELNQLLSNGICCSSVMTSDVCDENNEIEINLQHNYQLNGIRAEMVPIHIPHTWGTGWHTSAAIRGITDATFDTVIASDILLYVSTYPDLVITLTELIPPLSHTKFIMSWNRRMKESQQFFILMSAAGFHYSHEGKCIYVFQRTAIV